MDYIGEKCVLCGHEFVSGDDVVVCPDCGSPHHRDCYKIENKCANSALHSENFRWQRQLPKAEVKSENSRPKSIVVCPSCSYPNSENDEYCQQCGAPLSSTSAENAQDSELQNENGFGIHRPYLGFDPEEDLGGATLKEVSQFVKTNTIYYIPIFKRMKDIGTKVSFNLLCFIFPPMYFANRRMWLWAFITAILTVIMGIPATISFMVSSSIESGYQILGSDVANMIYAYRDLLSVIIDICNVGDILMRILLCIFGNWMYFRFSVKTLQKLKHRSGGHPVTSAEVASAGGVKPANMLLIIAITAALSLAALYASVVVLNVVYLMGGGAL